jgi:hypothetical protein
VYHSDVMLAQKDESSVTAALVTELLQNQGTIWA